MVKMPTWAERIASAAAAEAVSKIKGQGKGRAQRSKGPGGGAPGSKGGGKDGAQKGSSKGGGKGPGQSSTSGWWQCPVKQCAQFCGGTPYWNHPKRTECNCCQQPRGSAGVSAAAEREMGLKKLRSDVAASAEAKKPSLTADGLADMVESSRLECLRDMARGVDTGLSKGAQKRLKREATVEELKTAGLPVPTWRLTAGSPSDGGSDSVDLTTEEEEPEDDETPEARFGVSEERMTELGIAWSSKRDPPIVYPMPHENTPMTAAAIVARALEGEVSETIAAKRTSVAKLVEATETLRASLGEKDELYQKSVARLKTDTEDLQRMLKKAQPKNGSAEEGSKVTCLRLKLAKQEEEKAQLERAQRQARGKANTAKRQKQQKQK